MGIFYFRWHFRKEKKTNVPWYWCSPTAYNSTSLRCNYVSHILRNTKGLNESCAVYASYHHKSPKNGNSSPEEKARKYTSKKNFSMDFNLGLSLHKDKVCFPRYPIQIEKAAGWWRDASWPLIIHNMSWTVGQLVTLGEKGNINWGKSSFSFCRDVIQCSC